MLEILSKKRYGPSDSMQYSNSVSWFSRDNSSFSDPEISHTFRGLVSQFYQKVNFATVDDDTSKDVAKKYKITVGNR